jgi:hypothetical protein
MNSTAVSIEEPEAIRILGLKKKKFLSVIDELA